MKPLKKTVMILSGIFGILIVLFAIALLLLTIFRFTPERKTDLTLVNPQGMTVINKETLTAMIWNTGYAGLGEEMDFFYDGGEKVRPTESACLKNLEQISNFIKSNDRVDFIMLQEVDKKAKRSYLQNETEIFGAALPNHNFVFAKNYDVPFVPVPLTNPMGKVVSGLMTLSKYEPVSSERISFPGNYAWPKNLFMLDRCFIIQRYRLAGGKELVLLNTHNSAFDDGELRKRQMQDLRNVALDESGKGNYVVIGGDWNQNPPGFDPEKCTTGDKMKKNDLGNIPADLMPNNWHWCFDGAVPTNRFVDKPYIKGETFTTVIDFFLLSPNLKLSEIKTIDLGFENSDHNPVVISFLLLQK